MLHQDLRDHNLRSIMLNPDFIVFGIKVKNQV